MRCSQSHWVSLFCFFTFMFTILYWSPSAFSQGGSTAVIIDTAGVETEVTDLASEQKEFAAYSVNGAGFSIVTKHFQRSPRKEEAGRMVRWVFFSQVAKLSVDNKKTVSVELKNGAFIKGRIEGDVRLRGKFALGFFELSMDKVRTLKIISAPEPPSFTAKGKSAVVELQDGEKISTNDCMMYRWVSSGYINVPSKDYMDPIMWVKIKRGEGLVKMEIPFEKVRRIDFDKPVVKADSYETGNKVRVTLLDGSILSGTCGGDGQREECHSLTGITEIGPINIYGSDLGYSVRSISFTK